MYHSKVQLKKKLVANLNYVARPHCSSDVVQTQKDDDYIQG